MINGKSGAIQMRRVLIVEDNKLETEALEKVVHNIDSNIQVLLTDNLGEAFQYAIQHQISVFIVDIVLDPRNMTDVSGLEFVENIRKLPQYKSTPVIFVTGLNDPRLYAYENLHCYRYIQKPLFYSEVEQIVRETLELNLTRDTEDTLKIKKDGTIYVIHKKEIMYAYSKAAKMTIVTERDQFTFFYLTCTTLLDMLKSERFQQCSRSTIINYDFVRSVDQRKNLIELQGCTEKIKIGKLYKKVFLKGLLEDDGMAVAIE